MSSWAVGLLLAVQATCVPSGDAPAETADAVATVRTFFDLGDHQRFEAIGALLVPGAVGENSEGETFLVTEMLDYAEEEGVESEPTQILDTMTAPGSVVVKVRSEDETAIMHFRLDGICIARITQF